ncbi:hypothetical protein ACFX12_024723 [Malus domestica]
MPPPPPPPATKIPNLLSNHPLVAEPDVIPYLSETLFDSSPSLQDDAEDTTTMIALVVGYEDGCGFAGSLDRVELEKQGECSGCTAQFVQMWRREGVERGKGGRAGSGG